MSGIDAHWPQKTGGRPLDYKPEVVEAALWHVALAGGEVRAGQVALREALCADAGVDPNSAEAAGIECPSESTVRKWVKGRFRNRYHEILEVKGSELEGRIANSAVELAVLLEDGERRAIKQTMTGLGSATAVEASTIGRNLSQMKKIQVEAAGQIRGRRAFEEALPALGDLARSMAAMGFATLARANGEPVVDVDAEEYPEAQLAG